jgi:hypothetical protein
MTETQACRFCGRTFPYSPDADICPACVLEQHPDLTITIEIYADSTPDKVYDLTGNDAVEWRADVHQITSDDDVSRVVVKEHGQVIHEWMREPFAGYDENTRAGFPPDGDTGE